MFIVQAILVGVYACLLTFILLYSFIQGSLVLNYIRNKKKVKEQENLLLDTTDDDIPFVTVQLPVFNEKYVVERLIEAVAAFDYPKNKFEIQVLDDSTDETLEITINKVNEIKKQGINIEQVTRENRVGFKAGALEYGTKLAKGEFIAIFDADFLPEKDFLKRTIPYFVNPEIGVVQTRWEHINKDYSLLTSLQAFGLDAHFTVEQKGRNAGGHFINFNGTAGVWRKECIIDAGGWQADTLTEDLDLSYRAQLKGWKFKFLETVGSPAELPAAMNALKTQQFRWTKGAAECTRKNLGKVWRAKGLGFSTKIHALFHLMNSFLFVCIITTAILSIPMLLFKSSLGEYTYIYKYGAAFLISLLLLTLFYWVSFNATSTKKKNNLIPFVLKFPLFLSISMGLSLHNGIAVLEGYMGKKTPFIRTPKFNLKAKTDSWSGNQYLTSSINLLTFLEGALTIYFSTGIIMAFWYNDFGLLPFHIMLTFGFGAVFYYSFIHSKNTAKES